MNQWSWRLLKETVDDLSVKEVDWRPLPQGNNISTIVRHLRIEAQWHLDGLKHGAAMPWEATPALQKEIDAIPLDFQPNLRKLEELFTEFLNLLHAATPQHLQQRMAAAYGAADGFRKPVPPLLWTQSGTILSPSTVPD